MESPTQSTFIPHEAVMSSGRSNRQSGLSELFLLISILLLIISGALGAGVFLYTQYLQTATASKLQQLNTTEAAFDPSIIQEFTRLDSRMNSAQQLLSAHLAPTLFFTMLEQTTAQDISFTSLDYDASNPQQITIKMSGVAGSVNSIALQAQLFSQSGMITSPIFSDISAQQDGVHFDFSALLNPSAMSYESLVTGTTQNPSSGSVQTQTPATPAGQTPSGDSVGTSPLGAAASPFETGSAATTTQPQSK